MISHETLDARPRLRRLIGRQRNGNHIVFHDLRRIGRPIGVTPLGNAIAERLDGTRTLSDIQSDLLALTGGALVPLDLIQQLVSALDEALLLDSPRVKSLFAGPVRKPSHFRPDADKAALGQVIQGLFTAEGGAGLPAATPASADRLRAVLLPHMDYGRGNITYGHGFKELLENSSAKLFVVIATSHYSAGPRFTLTRQHFDTPYGLVETDVDYVNRIVALYGDGLFDDEEAHAPEHSIELELTPLKHLRGDATFRIVPLLVGSFADCTGRAASPRRVRGHRPDGAGAAGRGSRFERTGLLPHQRRLGAHRSQVPRQSEGGGTLAGREPRQGRSDPEDAAVRRPGGVLRHHRRGTGRPANLRSAANLAHARSRPAALGKSAALPAVHRPYRIRKRQLRLRGVLHVKIGVTSPPAENP